MANIKNKLNDKQKRTISDTSNEIESTEESTPTIKNMLVSPLTKTSKTTEPREETSLSKSLAKYEDNDVDDFLAPIDTSADDKIEREKAQAELNRLPGLQTFSSTEAVKKVTDRHLEANKGMKRADSKVLENALEKIKGAQKAAEAEFKETKDLQGWLAIAETMAQAMLQISAGRYGMKHGIDMSGVKFSKTDWSKKLDQLNKEMDRKIAGYKDERTEAIGQEDRRVAKEDADLSRARQVSDDARNIEVGQIREDTAARNAAATTAYSNKMSNIRQDKQILADDTRQARQLKAEIDQNAIRARASVEAQAKQYGHENNQMLYKYLLNEKASEKAHGRDLDITSDRHAKNLETLGIQHDQTLLRDAIQNINAIERDRLTQAEMGKRQDKDIQSREGMQGKDIEARKALQKTGLEGELRKQTRSQMHGKMRDVDAREHDKEMQRLRDEGAMNRVLTSDGAANSKAAKKVQAALNKKIHTANLKTAETALGGYDTRLGYVNDVNALLLMDIKGKDEKAQVNKMLKILAPFSPELQKMKEDADKDTWFGKDGTIDRDLIKAQLPLIKKQLMEDKAKTTKTYNDSKKALLQIP